LTNPTIASHEKLSVVEFMKKINALSFSDYLDYSLSVANKGNLDDGENAT
jgi:hypothetical protein